MPTNRLRPAFATTEDQLVQVGKAIHDELKSSTDRRLENLEAMVALRAAELIRKEIELRLSDLTDQFSAKVDDLRRGYVETLATLAEVIRTLPPPVVNVSVPEQPTPLVNVSLPEMTPLVTVNVPELSVPQVYAPVSVNLPELRPEVLVNVPEQTLPQVTVTVPPPRLVKKEITYDGHGRPVIVTEHDAGGGA